MTEVEEMQAAARADALAVRGRSYRIKSGTSALGFYAQAERDGEQFDVSDAVSAILSFRPQDISTMGIKIGVTLYDDDRNLAFQVVSVKAASGGLTAVGCTEHATP